VTRGGTVVHTVPVPAALDETRRYKPIEIALQLAQVHTGEPLQFPLVELLLGLYYEDTQQWADARGGEEGAKA